MLSSIPGSEAFELIRELKSLYGVKQNAVAGTLGISRQAVTDMKAGRRHLTRPMAEKLLRKFAAEPWAEWLRARLDALFTPEPTRFMIPAELPPQFKNNTDNSNSSVATPSPHQARRAELPVLTSLCQGELPTFSGQRYTVVPNELFMQTAEHANSYVYEIGFNSQDGRLRRGDWVLVIQDTERECEIMVVQYKGALRLARRGSHERILNELFDRDDRDWVLLDSGVVVSGFMAVPTGCVVGIVMARL